MRSRSASILAGKFPAVHHGHTQVQQNQGGLTRVNDVERSLAAMLRVAAELQATATR